MPIWAVRNISLSAKIRSTVSSWWLWPLGTSSDCTTSSVLNKHNEHDLNLWLWLGCLLRVRRTTCFPSGALHFHCMVIFLHPTIISCYNLGHAVGICIKKNVHTIFILLVTQKSTFSICLIWCSSGLSWADWFLLLNCSYHL